MVKCLTHGLRGFNGAIQRRLATLTVTMLISSCWQLSSEVELRRIFDVCKRWANSGSHEFVKKNMVRYLRPHGQFAHCSCKHATLTLDLGLSVSAAGSCCIFTLAVRQPPVLASCIEIYYSFASWNPFPMVRKKMRFWSGKPIKVGEFRVQDIRVVTTLGKVISCFSCIPTYCIVESVESKVCKMRGK